MWRQTLKATLALVAVGLASTAAYAHADLKAAIPAANGSTKTEVKEIRLSFSEGVNPKFSGVELKDQGGKAIAVGTAAIDPKNKKELVVPLLAPLPAGTYTVDWHAVSDDTHRVKGQYRFKVER